MVFPHRGSSRPEPHEPRRFHAGQRRWQPGTLDALRLDRRLRAHSRLLSDFGAGSDSHLDCRRQALAQGAALIGIHDLPKIDAVLNATAAVLLVTAFIFIKQGRREAHKRTMLGAFAVSSVFLVCYLIYHSQVGSVHYPRTGLIRAFYLTILTTHTILAASVPVLAIITL